MTCTWAAAVAILAVAAVAAMAGGSDQVSRSVIKLDIPAPRDSAGGMIVADVDDDGKMDYLVTVPGHLAVYGNDGGKLWIARTEIVVGGQSESQGLPGHHGPGVAAGDVDGDGRCEVVYLTTDSRLHVVEGATGKEKASAAPPVPEGAARWEQAMIADFRGAGDRDILLQATNKAGYRTGRYLAAYALADLLAGKEPLWTTDGFVSCAHNGARLADINGDGKDEVLGATILSADGEELTRAAKFRGHMDSVFVANVAPDRPGLEVVLLEEGSNSVQVLRAGSEEVFIWCRTRYNEHQKPFVLDARGRKVAEYAMDDVAPKGWTVRGVEVIHTIDWTGSRQQLACAKERHRSGDVCVFEPLTGRFVARIPEKADRLYVADVTGDWREEIIVQAGSELHVYANAAANPRGDVKRLWTGRNYRRLKQCHNYYSP